MSFKRDIPRSEFFKELTNNNQKGLQKELFSVNDNKFLPTVDNVYYTVFLEGDLNRNLRLVPLMYKLEELKELTLSTRVPQWFDKELLVDGKSYQLYKYCITQPDLYDIFIINYLPNTETPRILVQIRAQGLWTRGAEQMLMESYNSVKKIFEPLGCRLSKCRENRIDYCYHTNIIANPEKVFSDNNVSKQMKTTMKKWCQMGDIEPTDTSLILHKDYFSLGNRSSNYVFIRLYNKALEVIQKGYKNFFFQIWYDNGLISFYDKYCFEYAFTYKDYEKVHKAKLLFYLEYGTNDTIKERFKQVLNNPNSTLQDYKTNAKKHMPELTTIMNIEFETRRKFYYYSDDIIDIFKTKERPSLPTPLKRMFKIIDNRAVFLDYLTSKMLAFKKNEDEYATWWKRLRNTKLDGLKAEEKLLREYSRKLDERQTKVRFVNTVATSAVYNDNIETDFISDISDLLANLNDNHVNAINISLQTKDGKEFNHLDSTLLTDYSIKKLIKNKRLKNRKKNLINRVGGGD